MTIFILLIVLIVLASLLLILAVLVQNPKSGMAANFGVSNQVIGVRETTDKLEKFTWTMAIAIVVLSVGATMAIPKNKIDSSKSEIAKELMEQGQGSQQFQFPAKGETKTDAAKETETKSEQKAE
jgi:preprotein translocase subunit SecG